MARLEWSAWTVTVVVVVAAVAALGLVQGAPVVAGPDAGSGPAGVGGAVLDHGNDRADEAETSEDCEGDVDISEIEGQPVGPWGPGIWPTW